MDSEVKEKRKARKVVDVRLELPEDVHSRVVRYQARLIGRRGEKVTLPDTCVELLTQATRKVK